MTACKKSLQPIVFFISTISIFIITNGCAQTNKINTKSSSTTTIRTLYIQNLIQRYHPPQIDKQSTLNDFTALAEIQALRGDEARFFNHEILKLTEQEKNQPTTEEEKKVKTFFLAFIKEADARGLTIMSLSKERVEQIVQDILSGKK